MAASITIRWPITSTPAARGPVATTQAGNITASALWKRSWTRMTSGASSSAATAAPVSSTHDQSITDAGSCRPKIQATRIDDAGNGGQHHGRGCQFAAHE